MSHYPENHRLLADPRVRIHLDDGRRWLKRHPAERFDFILMNTTFHWRSQVNNLVSAEFLELCRRHLNPGGVLYYNTTQSPDIPYTAARIFPYVTTYSNFVAASDSPFTTSVEEKKARLALFDYRGRPLKDRFPEEPELEAVVSTMAGQDTGNRRQAILSRKGRFNLITDDNLASEFKTNEPRFYSEERNYFKQLRSAARKAL